MPKFKITYVIDASNLAEAKKHGNRWAGLDYQLNRVRGPLKKWEITYKGNSISYTYRSKAAARIGLKGVRGERWDNDPKDYSIRLI